MAAPVAPVAQVKEASLATSNREEATYAVPSKFKRFLARLPSDAGGLAGAFTVGQAAEGVVRAAEAPAFLEQWERDYRARFPERGEALFLTTGAGSSAFELA